MTQSEEFIFKRCREDLAQFKNRPDLKEIKDSLLKLPLMIMSLASTIKRLKVGLCQFTVKDSTPPLLQSFECLQEEAQLLQKRIDMLRDRVQDLTGFAHDKLNHLNSQYMMQVAQSTKNDSAAMKYITIITVLFLPATFVAVRQFHPLSINDLF
jgi:Mg2+ and Co2+ transporter CorA